MFDTFDNIGKVHIQNQHIKLMNYVRNSDIIPSDIQMEKNMFSQYTTINVVYQLKDEDAMWIFN